MLSSQLADTPRDIDVLFLPRCSATNYTYHEQFLGALTDLQPLRTVFADPTKYLQHMGPLGLEFAPYPYPELLWHCRTAVAFQDNGYGGLAIREAVRAGCVPVLLDCGCYKEWAGYNWPCLTSLNAPDIRRAVDEALHIARSSAYVLPDVRADSYQSTWHAARRHLEALL